MIPLHKLEKLPRHQQLRKIEKIFSGAESRFCPGATVANNADELHYFSGIAQFLSHDPLFSQTARDFFVTAAELFRQAAAVENAAALRRVLNSAKHLLLAETGRSQADWDFIGGDGRPDPARRRVFPGIYVYLEDIRSPFNVGAMFRSAESFGAEKMFLSPFCADPNHARARRTSMGCVDVLPWERREFFAAETPPSIAETPAPQLSVPVFALETGGIPLAEFPFPQQGLLIAGSEELGVSPRALAAADASLGRVSIPCYGAKGSLNVSVAFGIVMQGWAQAIIMG